MRLTATPNLNAFGVRAGIAGGVISGSQSARAQLYVELQQVCTLHMQSRRCIVLHYIFIPRTTQVISSWGQSEKDLACSSAKQSYLHKCLLFVYICVFQTNLNNSNVFWSLLFLSLLTNTQYA